MWVTAANSLARWNRPHTLTLTADNVANPASPWGTVFSIFQSRTPGKSVVGTHITASNNLDLRYLSATEHWQDLCVLLQELNRMEDLCGECRWLHNMVMVHQAVLLSTNTEKEPKAIPSDFQSNKQRRKRISGIFTSYYNERIQTCVMRRRIERTFSHKSQRRTKMSIVQ